MDALSLHTSQTYTKLFGLTVKIQFIREYHNFCPRIFTCSNLLFKHSQHSYDDILCLLSIPKVSNSLVSSFTAQFMLLYNSGSCVFSMWIALIPGDPSQHNSFTSFIGLFLMFTHAREGIINFFRLLMFSILFSPLYHYFYPCTFLKAVAAPSGLTLR